jgi:hypothetical protein
MVELAVPSAVEERIKFCPGETENRSSAAIFAVSDLNHGVVLAKLDTASAITGRPSRLDPGIRHL